MRQVVIHRAGGYEQLRIEHAPDPEPGADEVRIAVAAAGVNYPDCVVRMGLYASARHYVGWPITPGFEVAGRIVSVGAGVESVTIGDPVLAVTRFGAYATDVVVPADQVFSLPSSFTLEQGAAFAVTHLTAYYALLELANPRPRARILVHSAAGGVGTALLRLANIAELEVVGVVGASHKRAVALEHGASEVIDKSTQALWPEAERLAPEGYDVVLDANGPATLRQSYAHLRPTGRLVVYGFHSMLPRRRGRPRWLKLIADYFKTPRFNPLDMTNQNRSVLAFNLSYLFERIDLLHEAMAKLFAWIENGSLPPPRVRSFAFDRVADAHRELESGTTVGKLVLRMDDP